MRETRVKTEEFKDSPLGRIPKDWEITCIGDLGTWRGGSTPSKSLASNWSDGEIVWVSPKDFRGTEITDSEDKITKQALTNHNITIFEPGNVLAVFRSSILRHTFPVAIGQVPFTVNQDVKVLSPRDNVNHRFAFFLLQFLGSEILRAAAKVGTTVESIDYSTFCNLPIYLPSIEEQEGIVEIIDTLDKAIAHTSSLIAKLKQMKAGLLHDLLTRGLDENGELRDAIGHPEQFKDSPLGRIPKDWEVRLLSAVAEINSGVTLGRNLSGLGTIELPYLRVFNVQDGYLDISDVKTIRVYKEEVPRFLLQPGDVLMNEGGDYDKLGRGTVWYGQISPCLHQNHVFRVRPNQDYLISEFLALVSGSAYGKRFFILSSKQSTNLASINSSQLKSFPIPCPPIAEQRKILDVFNAHDTRIRTEEAYRDKLKLQKQGLMHDLLTGKVRVKI